MALRTYVINRAADADRWAYVTESVKPHFDLELTRFDAIDGRADGFRISDHLPPGSQLSIKTPALVNKCAEAAILLSHAHCWHKVLNGPDEYALIVEDDVAFQEPVVELSNTLSDGFTFDLIFCNRRMILFRRALPNDDVLPQCLYLDEFHSRMVATFPAEEFETKRFNKQGRLPNGVGFDAYVVSRRGAEKLLELFEQLPEQFPVDNWAYAVSLDVSDFRRSQGHPRGFAKISDLLRPDRPKLDTYIFNRIVALSAGVSVLPSVREVRTDIGRRTKLAGG
ncbi:MAG: glycosyltransferase family 25 protein [Pseudomonadota bacterium]